MGKFIFVTGGVMSSVGKGIASASIGTLLQSRGFSIRFKKLDPYINVDCGTMNPYRHGEVFVMSDGGEADLDFGHYERFTEVESTEKDSITTGKIYSTVLSRERHGYYLGSDVQVVPHVTDLIKEVITYKCEEVDFTICEVGGTIGDIEGLPYIEALRQLKLELDPSQIIFVHLTYLPFIKTSGELKTKPTQHSVRSLQSLGIQPDILLCRSEQPIPQDIKKKISMFCNVKYENVIEALDAENIYFIPKMFHNGGLDRQICEHFGLEKDSALAEKNIEQKWGAVENAIKSANEKVRIAVVGKYVKMKDAYISVCQAIGHAGFANGVKVEVDWIDTENDFEDIVKILKGAQGIIVPGGFGVKGVENKIKVIQYARENKIPYLGICFGMQLAVIESCRHVGNVEDATSREFGDPGTCVVDFMKNWSAGDKIEERNTNDQIGGTMRLGNYDCVLQQGTLAFDIYKKDKIVERHRHRYEVNLKQYKDLFERCGIVFSGMSLNGEVPEVMERKDHPFFIAVQFHPEFKSHPFNVHPLFYNFIKATLKK